MPELPTGTVTFLFTDVEGEHRLKTLDRQPHNLSIQPTSLIGRESEVESATQ